MNNLAPEVWPSFGHKRNQHHPPTVPPFLCTCRRDPGTFPTGTTQAQPSSSALGMVACGGSVDGAPVALPPGASLSRCRGTGALSLDVRPCVALTLGCPQDTPLYRGWSPPCSFLSCRGQLRTHLLSSTGPSDIWGRSLCPNFSRPSTSTSKSCSCGLAVRCCGLVHMGTTAAPFCSPPHVCVLRTLGWHFLQLHHQLPEPKETNTQLGTLTCRPAAPPGPVHSRGWDCPCLMPIAKTGHHCAS